MSASEPADQEADAAKQHQPSHGRDNGAVKRRRQFEHAALFVKLNSLDFALEFGKLPQPRIFVIDTRRALDQLGPAIGIGIPARIGVREPLVMLDLVVLPHFGKLIFDRGRIVALVPEQIEERARAGFFLGRRWRGTVGLLAWQQAVGVEVVQDELGVPP